MASFSGLLKPFSADVGIDLGTANTLIYVRGQGIVLNEASIISVSRRGGRFHVLAVGNEAKVMLGKTPGNIETIRPLREGVIADFEMAGEMMTHFIRKVQTIRSFPAPRIAICIPSGATQVERRAIRESAESTGARETYLIEEPMAAAVGGGLPVLGAQASMIVDVGGGTTEVGIIALGGLVATRSVRIGGNQMDEDLAAYVRDNFNVQLGEQSAEVLKNEIGMAYLPEDGSGSTRNVRGMDINTGLPREIVVSQKHTVEAFTEAMGGIVAAVRQTLAEVKPEIAADIIDRGILLTGGGALLQGLDEVLRKATGLPVLVPEDPMLCVVHGTGEFLENKLLLHRLIEIDASF